MCAMSESSDETTIGQMLDELVNFRAFFEAYYDRTEARLGRAETRLTSAEGRISGLERQWAELRAPRRRKD
jgi:hypothetical protein